MQNVNVNGHNVRFNLPTTDGQPGRIHIDGGEAIKIDAGEGFTIGSRWLQAGEAFILKHLPSHDWKEISGERENANPIALMVEILTESRI